MADPEKSGQTAEIPGEDERTIVLSPEEIHAKAAASRAARDTGKIDLTAPSRTSALNTARLKAAATQVISTLIGKKRRDIDAELDADKPEANAPAAIDSELAECLNDVLNEYEPGETVAEGGQGIIVKAYDKSLSRNVAIKSLRDTLKSDQQARREFISEARITATLDHPAIVPIYSLNGDKGDGLHLAMKLIRGKSLKDYIEQICSRYQTGGVQSFDEASSTIYRIEIFLRVCEAIGYAHSRGVLHRDLKPENIMIGDFRETYIMDWGIAQFVGPDGKIKADPSRIVGTPRYLAPEVLTENYWDARSDIYALGLILFECVTLTVAVPGDSVKTTIGRVRSHRFEPIVHRFGCRISPDLAAIIRKATALDPDERYQSAAELADDLRRYLRGEEVTANPDTPLGRLARWSSRHRRLVFFAALLMLLCGVSLTAINLHKQIVQSEIDRKRENVISYVYAQTLRTANRINTNMSHIAHLLSLLEANTAFLLHHHPRSDIPADTRFYRPQDFRDPKLRPEGTVYCAALGEHISLDHFVCLAPPTMDEAEKLRYLRLLEPLRNRMIDTLLNSIEEIRVTDANREELRKRALAAEMPLLWVYIGLKNGLFIALPGGEGYPPGYDPRTRPWYSAAAPGNGAPVWGAPYVDVGVAEQGVITCSVTIRDCDGGSDYGVAATDMSFSHIINLMRESGSRNEESLVYRALVDSSGNYLVGTGQVPARPVSNVPLIRDQEWREMIKKRFGVTTKIEDGREKLYVFAHIPMLNWYYIEKFDMIRLISHN